MNAIMYAEWIPLIIFESRNSPALIEEQYGWTEHKCRFFSAVTRKLSRSI